MSLSPLPGAQPQAVAPSSGSSDRVERLLTRAQAGDIAAFQELVRTHQARIYSLALRMLGLCEDAQELAQDVFVMLHRHLPKIVSAAHLGAWLRKTVCHRAIDRLRSRPRHICLPLEAADEQEAAGQDSDPFLERYLRQLIAGLPPTARSVVLLRYQEDLDPAEIAEELGIPINTVKSHLRRSLALIRARCVVMAGIHGND